MEWLNKLFEFISELFPRLDLLPPNYGGVKFKPGNKTDVLRPGHLYIYWPVVSTVESLPIARQTVSFAQRLTTSDDYTILVETIVVYTIDNVRKALVDTHDLDETIGDVVKKGTIKAICSRSFNEIKTDVADKNEISKEITRITRSALRQYGAKVDEAFISNYTETTVFSHDGSATFIGDGSVNED